MFFNCFRRAAICWLLTVASLLVETQNAYAESGIEVDRIVNEVIMSAQEPKGFDWRRSNGELQVHLGSSNHLNLFDNRMVEVLYNRPDGLGGAWRFGWRRANTFAGPNVAEIAKTDFLQEALVNRHEFIMGYVFAFYEGKTISRMSPWFPDMDHAVRVVAASHYSHASPHWIPEIQQRVEPMPVQKPVNHTLGGEVGFEGILYFSAGWGFSSSFTYHLALIGGGENLYTWMSMTSGLIFSWGQK